jgi:hypothetical protein
MKRFSDSRKNRDDEQNSLTFFPCIICGDYDSGEYVIEYFNDSRQENGITVISRACLKCWQEYHKVTSQIQNFYKYGFKHPWPIEDDFLRRFLLKNEHIRRDLQYLGLIS